MENEILPGSIEAMIAALKSIGKGSLAEQISEQLQESVKATVIEGKKSSIVIKLEISKQSDEMITLTGSSEAKIPKPKPSGSFFVDPMKNYQIGRNRPNQQILPDMEN